MGAAAQGRGAPTKRGSIAKGPAPAAAPGAPRAKLSYKDQRDYDLLPKRIEALDAAIARDQRLLEDPELYIRDPDGFERLMASIGQSQADKDTAELRWLELAEQVEALG